jgi:uncharacterized protein YndB with AHSA1/START domain
VSETITTDREIIISRIFDAPRELVWEAFTDPVQIVQWWGPDGFTNTLHEMDVRPGGIWRHTMHGPDGVDYPNLARYIEVVRPARLVYELREDVPGAQEHFTATVTLEERDGGTEVTLHMLFPDAASRAKVVGYAVEGGKQTLGRLAEHLAQKVAS